MSQDGKASSSSRQMASPRDLESSSTPHEHNLEQIKPRLRLRPNFFLKATLLTFDDFKERFGRVHADLLEDSGGRVDGIAPRGTCSACETNSQKGDHKSIRSKSSTPISRNVTTPNDTTWNSNRYSVDDCLKGGDKPTKETRKKHSNAKDLIHGKETREKDNRTKDLVKETREKHSKNKDLLLGKETRKKHSKSEDIVIGSRAYRNDCNMLPVDTSSTGHVRYSESTNSQSESAFKPVHDDHNTRGSKYSKSVTCKLDSHKPRHANYRVGPSSASMDMTKGCLRKTNSVGSSTAMKVTSKLSNFTKKCLDATQYKGMRYEICENDCQICNTSAVIDHVSGKLKRADSDRANNNRPMQKCQRICSETSIIRSCVITKRSEMATVALKKPSDEFIDKSETCSVASECERCSHTSLVQRTSVEDLTDDTNRVLASKAKMYGFNYEDICDVWDPSNECSNSDEESIDDLKHLNRGRYSNDVITKTKMMIIRRSNKKTGSGFTLGLPKGFSNILKPFQIIVRYFPVPPVNIISERNKSTLDILLENEDMNEIIENKNAINEDVYTTDDSCIGQVSVTTIITLDNEDSHNSVWMGDSACSLLSETSAITTDENASEHESGSSSDIIEPELSPPITVTPPEIPNTPPIGQLGNYALSRQMIKRNKSEPYIDNNQGHTLKRSVSDLVNAPSRFIPIRDYECYEPCAIHMNTTIVRLISLPFILFAGYLLGYPILIMFALDMFFGPDFSFIIYVVIGIIIALVCMQWKKSRRGRNYKKWNMPIELPKQIRNIRQ